MADLSLRDAYQHVVRSDDESGVISLDGFFLRPQGVRHAIDMMVPAPGRFWRTSKEYKRDDVAWAEEMQGIACAGEYFLLVSGGSKGGRHTEPAAIHAMDRNGAIRTTVLAEAMSNFQWKFKAVLPSVGGPGEPVDFHHIGHIITDGETVYLDHFDSVGNAHILVLDNPGQQGTMHFNRWIPIEPVPPMGRMGMVAFDPVGQYFITVDGNIAISELYLHDISGKLVKRSNGARCLSLQDTGDYNADLPWYLGYIQGGALSPRGHLYVASGRAGVAPMQPIRMFSVLTGRLYHEIPVQTEGAQEVEGICLANATMAGQASQLQVIMLQNRDFEIDDVYWKCYAASEPDLV